MKMRENHTDHLHIFTPNNWIDNEASPLLEQQFENAIAKGITSLVIDCSQIDYISSAGLRAICKTAKKLQPLNGILILCALEDYVEEIFEISGINALMVIKGNLDEAILYLSRDAHA